MFSFPIKQSFLLSVYMSRILWRGNCFMLSVWFEIWL